MDTENVITAQNEGKTLFRWLVTAMACLLDLDIPILAQTYTLLVSFGFSRRTAALTLASSACLRQLVISSALNPTLISGAESALELSDLPFSSFPTCATCASENCIQQGVGRRKNTLKPTPTFFKLCCLKNSNYGPRCL